MTAPAGRGNRDIALQLDTVADMLVVRGAPPRRSNLYRRGAAALRALGRPVSLILHVEGLSGLIRLPGIGEKLARAVRRAATTGQLPILERLTASSSVAGKDRRPAVLVEGDHLIVNVRRRTLHPG